MSRFRVTELNVRRHARVLFHIQLYKHFNNMLKARKLSKLINFLKVIVRNFGGGVKCEYNKIYNA